MKKHICKKILELEEMTQNVAEQKLEKKINNLKFGTDGYLYLDLNTMKMDWLPKEFFGSVMPYDRFTDMIKNDMAEMDERYQYFSKLVKTTFPSDEFRKRAMVVKRRLGTVLKDFHQLLQIAQRYEE